VNALPSTLLQVLRSRGFALGVHLALWLLLYLSLTSLGGKAPPFGEATSPLRATQTAAAGTGLESLFAPFTQPRSVGGSNSLSPFFTRYFAPAPAPAAPPPPTTRKLEMVYQGYYETPDQPKHVVVKLGDAYLTAAIGTALVTNLFVAEVTMQNLIFTNQAGQSNLFLLNVKKEIEVPIR